MLSLALGTFGYALFSITVKAATRHRCNIIAVGTVNYIVASGFYWILTAPIPMPGSAVSLLGIGGGIIFSTAFLVLARFIRRRGLSITISVVQLAVLIPVLAGIVVWDERPSLIQAIGILVAISALPFLSRASTVPNGTQHDDEFASSANGSSAESLHPVEGQQRDLGGILLTAAQLILTGAAMMTLQSFGHMGGTPEERIPFFAILFGTAIAVCCAAWLIFERRMSCADAVYGLLLGSWNALHCYMLVDAMELLPSAVVFPFVSIVSMLFSLLAAVCLWGERLERTGRIGIALALMAVLFINIGRG